MVEAVVKFKRNFTFFVDEGLRIGTTDGVVGIGRVFLELWEVKYFIFILIIT